MFYSPRCEQFGLQGQSLNDLMLENEIHFNNYSLSYSDPSVFLVSTTTKQDCFQDGKLAAYNGARSYKVFSEENTLVIETSRLFLEWSLENKGR